MAPLLTYHYYSFCLIEKNNERVIRKYGSIPQKGADPISGIIGINMKIQITIIKIIKLTFSNDLFGHIFMTT